MASKYERPPGSGTWVLRAYVGMDRGKRVYEYRGFKGGARDAERAARAFQHEVDARAVPAVTAGTVGEVLEDFYAKHAWKTTGAKNKAREDLDRYLIPNLGSLRKTKITEKHIEDLYEGLQSEGPKCLARSGKALADATVDRLHTTLLAAFNWAVKRKVMSWNPAAHVETAFEAAPAILVPEPEEVHAILAAATGEFATFVRIAAATGRRRQDILGLRLGDVKAHEPALVFDERVNIARIGTGLALTPNQARLLSLLADEPVASDDGRAAGLLKERSGHQTTIAVTRALADLENRGFIERERNETRTFRIDITQAGQEALAAKKVGSVTVERLDKNKRAARIGVDQPTMDAVSDHIAFVQARSQRFSPAGLLRDAFLFSEDPRGAQPWRPDHVTHKFGKLTKKLGMPYTLHSLRHFHITELLTKGMDVETVAGRVGDDPRTIYKTYSHWRKAADQRAAEVIGSVLNADSRPTLRVV
jgi:integrase